jgi:hypothetical protein
MLVRKSAGIWMLLLAGLGVAACGEDTLNRPPVISAVVASPATVDPGATLTVTVAATDPDGNPLSYDWTLPPGWTSIGDTKAATLALTAPASWAQSATVLVTVSDGKGGTAAGQAVVTTGSADTAPTFTQLSATPNPVAPGGTVSLAATAAGASGAPITYQWTSSDANWTLAATDGTAILTAPHQYGATTSIVVTAADGLGGVATGNLVVTTSTGGPVISWLQATPSNVQPGGIVDLTANVQNPTGLALTYGWTAAGTGWSISGTGANAKLTAPATINASTVVTLTVTDAANASVSANVSVQTTDSAAPVAVIAGTPPLAGTVNGPVLLDGSGSHSPIGNPVGFDWEFISVPAGAHPGFTTDTAQTAENSPKVYLTGDKPGLYNVQLRIIDMNSYLTSYATTQVQLQPSAKIVVVSGDAQSGTVDEDLPDPLVVQVQTADGQPVPGVPLGWDVANGTGLGASATTDAEGRARIVVRPGTIAGPGTVRVWLSADRTVNKALTFTGTAGPAASITVRGGVGTVVDGVQVTVQVTDQFGNLALDNTAALTAPFRLRIQSVSGKAKLAPAGGSPTTVLDAALAGGTYSVLLTDSAAEPVTVTIERRTPDIGLPFAGWAILAHDDFERGLRPDFWSVTQGDPGTVREWSLATGATRVHAGSRAAGLELAGSETVSPGSLVAAFVSSAVPYWVPQVATAVRAELQHNLQYASAPAAPGDCTAQPAFWLLAYDPFYGTTSEVAPVGGYPVLDACGGRRSLAATSGWSSLLVDLTGRYSSIALVADTGATAALNPAQPASWYIDDVRTWALAAPSVDGSGANVFLSAGPAAKITVAAAVADFAGAVSGAPTTIIASIALLDANGNPVQEGAQVYRLAWSGSAVATHVQSGALVATGTRQVDLKLEEGRAQVRLEDVAVESVHFTVGNPNAYAGIDVTATADVVMPPATTAWQHHALHLSSGVVAQYSDVITLAAPPYPQAAALQACEAALSAFPQYLTGGCSTASDLPNTIVTSYYEDYDDDSGEHWETSPYYFAYDAGQAPPGHRFCRPLVTNTAACAANGWTCPTYAAGQAFTSFNASCTQRNPQCPSTRLEDRCVAWSFSLPGGAASASWP